MIVSKREQEELRELFAKYRDRLGGKKEDYFGLLYLIRKFKCDPEDAIKQVVIGESPYGVDGYYVDARAGNLYLFQFKWTDNHNELRKPMELLAQGGLERAFATGMAGATHDQVLRRLHADLYEYKAAIDRVFVHFVFKGKVDAAEQSAGLQERREALENKKYLVDAFFGQRPVDLVFEYIADKRIVVPPPPVSHTIGFEAAASAEGTDDQRLHVGFVPLMDLVEMYRALGQRFLDRNIRAGLSPDNSPNRHIREALTDIVLRATASPEVFVFNHNGVTLSVEQATIAKSKAELKVPRLLNGAQTITSVVKFLDDNADAPELKNGRDRLRRIRVLAKLVEHKTSGPDDDFVTTITVCNNRQNPVEPWNLRANDRIQCDLQDKFREELGIFYSRQENAFDNLSEADLDELNIADSRDIRIRPLAQTFLAIQGEIDKMSRLPEVFEAQKTYMETFRDSYLKADSRRIVLAYKVGLVLNSPMKRLGEQPPQWLQPAISRARNLVWALLIQALLNDSKLDEYLDQFGVSLAKELSFRTLTGTIAANRLLPVMHSVFSDGAYRAKIDQEKYAFARTKDVFRRCMDEARDRYDWTKRTA